MSDANVSSLTVCEQPEVVEESRWQGETEMRTWGVSGGLFAVGRGHRAGLTGCVLLAVFRGRRKTGSDSLCSPRMLNQPWWVWGKLSFTCWTLTCAATNLSLSPLVISRCVIRCLCVTHQAGRLLLRRFVSERMGIPWSEIRLERSPRGKPYLASPLKVITRHFNVECFHKLWQIIAVNCIMWRFLLLCYSNCGLSREKQYFIIIIFYYIILLYFIVAMWCLNWVKKDLVIMAVLFHQM